MGSTFSGIELGKRGLIAHQQAIQTTGHNMSNANTEGYSRQRVEFKPMDALYEPALNREERPGQVGQGTITASITRVRDEILEGKIVAGTNAEGYWEARDKYILMLEEVYNEPEEVSVRNLMDHFWEGWQELSLAPESSAHRLTVVKRGETLMDGIHNRNQNLTDIAKMINDDVEITTRQMNDLIREIAGINIEIEKVEAMDDNPNDLYDRRDLLVERLGKIVPITTSGKDPDEFLVHAGGVHLVQGGLPSTFELRGNPNNEGYWDIVRSDSEEQFLPTGGKLGSILELRDGDVRGEIQKLDNMSVNFVDLVNEIHEAAYGLDGQNGRSFFVEYPAINNVTGAFDRNGDGALDSTYVFRLTGQHSMDPQDMIGLQGTMTLAGPEGDINIDYFPTDTVEEVIERINLSGSEVVARLNRNGQLTLKGTPARDINNPDFVIRRVEDSGEFLAGYSGILANTGIGGAYDWEDPAAVTALAGGAANTEAFTVAPLAHPSAWIDVNREIVLDSSKVAVGLGQAGRPAEPGDNSAAVAIEALRNQRVMIGADSTFDDYFARNIGDVAAKGEQARLSFRSAEEIMKELRDLRDSISGVNMDEELAQLIKFQHGYAATARFITEVDKMLDTIINRMGV
jgi:flagellar hook-associated protein 1 FlgK